MIDRLWYGPLQGWIAVNHWWGFSFHGRYTYWAWGRLHWMADYPHTEN
jgi:hypothetical protein